jgi:DNA repair photolyase
MEESLTSIPVELINDARSPHDFPFRLGKKSFGGIGRKCPHTFLVNVTPDGNCCQDCTYCYTRDHRNSTPFDKVGKILIHRKLPGKVDDVLGKAFLSPPWYLCPVTDGFMPCSEVVDLTLEVTDVLIKHGVSFHYVTKSKLVEKSLDLVSNYPYFFLQVTVETIDPEKQKVLSPKASSVEERISILQRFSNERIYTVMRIDPIIWGFTNDWGKLREQLRIGRDVGVRHIICSTGRLGRSTLKSVPEALEKAGFEREAQTVRESYVFTKGFWFLPLEKRAMFHTQMREQVESLGMTYSVCGELGSGYDSKGIAEVDAARAELQDKMTKLEAKLAESVPRGEAERLSAEIEELQKNLAGSKSEAESLRADVAQLQDRLAESIPKAESEAKVNELETKLSGARRDPEVARTTIQDLEEKLSQSSAKIGEVQGTLSNSVPPAELETIKSELQSKIADLEGKL